MTVECCDLVQEASRYAGGKAQLVRAERTYVTPVPPLPQHVARRVNAIPASNSMRFTVTMTSTTPRCIPCGRTDPTPEHPGGGLECVVGPETFEECVVVDNSNGSTWSGRCTDLIGRTEPPSQQQPPVWPFIGLGIALGIVGVAAALLLGNGDSA